MKQTPASIIIILAGTLLICGGRQSLAATFNIPDGDVAGLIAAINTANTNNQDDTINLAAGTYTLTAVDTSPGSDGLSGLPVVGRDGTFDNFHHLTINGNAATLTRSTAVGTPEFRILKIANSTGGICTINSVTF